MKVSPFRPAKASRRSLPVAEFAREAGLSKREVGRRGISGEFSRTWQDKHSSETRRGRWMYFVGDLPETSGSAYLINYLTTTAHYAQREADDANEALSRVMLHRRSAVAA